jgi:DNA-binding response OmpR family regulator
MERDRAAFPIRGAPSPDGQDEPAGPLILIIEDDPDLRRILSFHLLAEGFRVCEAADGERGFDLLRTVIPDCIVLDLMMPVMDGFSFLKRLRGLNRTCAVPVVVLTASEDPRHRRRSDQYQADAFLTKPWQPEELLATIRRLCPHSSPV